MGQSVASRPERRDGIIHHGMRLGVWTPCCLVLLIGGCPRRQNRPRLVYVSPPPSSTSAMSEPESGTWVIEEPAPAEPEVRESTVEAPPPTPSPQPRPQRQRRSGVSAEPPSPESKPDEPTPVEPPPLEPAIGGGGAARRTKIETTQQDVSQRVAEFERGPLSDTERRTLDEAKAFVEQSRRALNEGDLQRSENLARKAYLLVTAFEQRH